MSAPGHCWCCECEACIPWGDEVPVALRVPVESVVPATWHVHHEGPGQQGEPACDECRAQIQAEADREGWSLAWAEAAA